MRALRVAATLVAAFLIAGAACADDLTINYLLSIDRPETGVGRVTMTVKGVGDRGLFLTRSTEAGEGWFDEVSAADAAGNPCEVRQAEGGWQVVAKGADRVVITYTIKPGEVANNAHLGLICAEYAALDGSFVFLVPGPQHNINSIDLKFDVPAKWKPVINWIDAGGSYTPNPLFAAPALQLADSLICLGDFASSSKKFGANDVVVYQPAVYPAADRDQLAATVFAVYSSVYGFLGCDTGWPYSVVCLPAAPDGLPVMAGAWADGQAVTLVGEFPVADAVLYTSYCARFIANAYFARPPFGVALTGDDLWLYPAVLRYAEGAGLAAVGQVDENVFFANIYADYSAAAVANDSTVDVPAADLRYAPPFAAEFIRRTKAPILLMRLDFEIRVATNDADNIETFIRALYAKGRNCAPGLSAFFVLTDLTQADFSDFANRFIRDRMLLLPTWPAFIEKMRSDEAPQPGPVVAKVDGVPIYQREVDILAEAISSQGPLKRTEEVRRAALAALVDEKLIDKKLAEFRVQVIPEAFWRLRLVLPSKVASLVITAKRQALISFLYDDWLARERKSSKIEMTQPEQ